MHIEYLRKTVYGSVMSVEELNELGAQGWILCAAVKMSDLDNYQWAFNHKHLIEGIFHTYVDYEEIEDLDNLFAE